MTKELAYKLLMVVACCNTIGLACEECPLWESGDCRPYTDEEVVKAVRFLNKEGR